MKEPIKITIFQAYVFWENVEKNLQNLALRLSSLKEKTDLIILPEMFNTGFTLNVESCAEDMQGPTMEWLFKMAQKFDCKVAGSLIVKEGEQYYNRFVWMSPDGYYDYYDKRHLMALIGEDKLFQAGSKRIVTEIKGWKICPMIGNDLRYPVWSRNTGSMYDIVVYGSAWPDSRSLHWRTLIPARALENNAYAIGVNRVGYDGNEVYYSGGSMCISPTAGVVYYKPEDEDLYTFTLNPQDLENERKQMEGIASEGDAFDLSVE